jgi:phosphohistidine phosphatase SixA
VTGRIDAFDPVVISVTKIAAGTTGNVIPESAELLGTIPPPLRARELAQSGLRQIAEGIASAHGAKATVTLLQGYPVTVNDAEQTAFAQGVVTDLLGERGFTSLRSPLMGAEDFSYVLEEIPGAMMFLGVRPDDPAQCAPCHSNRMVLNEEGMAAGIAVHAALALRALAGEERKAGPSMKLLVLRHDVAESREAGASRDADRKRALTPGGRKRARQAAQALARLVGSVDLLASSPLRRARETADALAAELDEVEVTEVDALAPEVAPAEVAAWLREQAGIEQAAIVGHEPGLSALVTWLVSGLSTPLLELGKGGACLLELPDHIAPGQARLVWLLRPGQLRRLR